MKLMILDGNSIVNRAFYGIRMLNAPDGTPTNGVYGFLSILDKLLGEENPDAYRDLMVRISGYNAYFVTLNRDMQLELIERAEYGL